MPSSDKSSERVSKGLMPKALYAPMNSKNCKLTHVKLNTKRKNATGKPKLFIRKHFIAFNLDKKSVVKRSKDKPQQLQKYVVTC